MRVEPDSPLGFKIEIDAHGGRGKNSESNIVIYATDPGNKKRSGPGGRNGYNVDQ